MLLSNHANSNEKHGGNPITPLVPVYIKCKAERALWLATMHLYVHTLCSYIIEHSMLSYEVSYHAFMVVPCQCDFEQSRITPYVSVTRSYAHDST